MEPYFELAYHGDGKTEITDIIPLSTGHFTAQIIGRSTHKLMVDDNGTVRLGIFKKGTITDNEVSVPEYDEITFDKNLLEDIAKTFLEMKLEQDRKRKLLTKT
ncbi:MAG: hypothetical protein V4547_18105 [Bacteroidota bacterium]